MTRALPAVLLVLSVLPARAQDGSPGRPGDDLLDRPDLQAIVDLQVRRDAEGLARRLDDPDPVVRARAAFALASVPGADAGRLAALLDDPDPRVRADAAFALGLRGDLAAAGDLLSAWEGERDPAVRRRVLEALGRVADSAALAAVAALEVDAGETRALAFALARAGLREVHHPAATRRLAAIVSDAAAPAAAREAAAWGLARALDVDAWRAEADAVRGALDEAYTFQYGGPDTLAPAGPAATPWLVTAVGRLEDPADTDRLLRWLEDGVDWRSRVRAARALGDRAREERAWRALLDAFVDPSTHVGVAAASALAAADSLPDPAVHDVAAWAVNHQSWWRVTAAALPVVAKGGVDGMIVFFLMWLDANDRDNHAARATALRALGSGHTTAGFLVLEDEAGWEDDRVAAAAVEGLAARWARGVVDTTATRERYFRAFARALERAAPGVVATAAPALADSAFAGAGAVERLAAAYARLQGVDDLEARIAVVEALGGTGDPAARRTLRDALRDPRRAVRAAAAEALGVETPGGADPPDRAIDWEALARLGPRPRLLLETEKGRIAIRMDAGQAPLTVQTVARLAAEGRYDGLPFHRVVPDFVIQGGDVAGADGWGGPGFAIRTELTRIPFERGTVGMASAGPDTEGSQFFVTHSIQPRLDGRYTAFGVVEEGLDVVDRILESDRIVSATVEADPGR